MRIVRSNLVGELSGAIRRAVVDDEDVEIGDAGSDSVEDELDVFCFVVRWDDDEPRVVDHSLSVPSLRRLPK